MTAYRIRKCEPERESPDDGRDAEYDKRRKQEEDRIRSLGNLTVKDLDWELEHVDLEEMEERDILQQNLDELARRHTERMRRGKNGGGQDR